MKFLKLFEPITINGMTLANRIVMPAMHLGMAEGKKVEGLDVTPSPTLVGLLRYHSPTQCGQFAIAHFHCGAI